MLQGSKGIVRRATELQEERRRANSRSLPIWVLPAILFFGWNELRDLMRSPVLLVCCVLLLLFLYQLYKDLDVDAELQKGMPAAAINIGRRIWPASKRIVFNTGEAIQSLFRARVLGQEDTQGDSMTTPGASPAPSSMSTAFSGFMGTPGGMSTPGSASARQRSPQRTPGMGSEIEMSPLMGNGSPVDGLRRRGDSSDAQSPMLGGKALDSAKDK